MLEGEVTRYGNAGDGVRRLGRWMRGGNHKNFPRANARETQSDGCLLTGNIQSDEIYTKRIEEKCFSKIEDSTSPQAADHTSQPSTVPHSFCTTAVSNVAHPLPGLVLTLVRRPRRRKPSPIAGDEIPSP